MRPAPAHAAMLRRTAVWILMTAIVTLLVFSSTGLGARELALVGALLLVSGACFALAHRARSGNVTYDGSFGPLDQDGAWPGEGGATCHVCDAPAQVKVRARPESELGSAVYLCATDLQLVWGADFGGLEARVGDRYDTTPRFVRSLVAAVDRPAR